MPARLTDAQLAQIRAAVEKAPPLTDEALAAIARAERHVDERERASAEHGTTGL
jgi:hypothetical protein